MRTKKSLNGKFIGKTAAWLTGIFAAVATPTYLIHQGYYANYQTEDIYVQQHARAEENNGWVSAHRFNDLDNNMNGWSVDADNYYFYFDPRDPNFAADNFERGMCFQPTVNGVFDRSDAYDLVEINRIPCPTAE